MPYARHAKCALTVVAATAVCHTVMSAGYAQARVSSSASDAPMFAGSVEFLLTTAASWVLGTALAGVDLVRRRTA